MRLVYQGFFFSGLPRVRISCGRRYESLNVLQKLSLAEVYNSIYIRKDYILFLQLHSESKSN
jgi:hypothetical protein